MPDLKIIKDHYKVSYVSKDLRTGREINYVRKLGLYVESRGSRHRRKPKPLTPTTFRINRMYINEKIISIPEPIHGSRWDNIPVASAMGRFCVTTIESKTDSGSTRLATALHKMAGSDFNFGETVVELDQSFNMVHNTVRRLYLYFLYAKQGNVQGIRNLLKSSDYRLRGTTPKKRLANAYLEYSFGWAPLVNDVYTAFTQTHNLITKKGATVRRYSGRRLGLTSDNWFDTDTSRAGAGGTIRNTKLSVVNQLGLANPALMAWNRLPFSFLVDWVLPISTHLGALTWDAGLSGQHAWYIDSSKSREVVNRVAYRQVADFISLGDERSRSERRKRVVSQNRFVALDLSSNSFQLSLSKIATLAALFTQLNSR